MVELQRIEPLPHIEIQREPEERSVRPRPFPGPRPQPRDNRKQHGSRLGRETTAASEELARLRLRYGVDPETLKVLRLDVLDVDQRQAMERLGIAIVEERRENQDGRQLYRVLGQFTNQSVLDAFVTESTNYGEGAIATTMLPPGIRTAFFDSLESVSLVTADERQGRRLQREGIPRETTFYLDVDLWNPGSALEETRVIVECRNLVERLGGRVVRDPLRIPSLILVKVEADARVLDALLNFDLVSLVDLSPRPIPEEAFDIFNSFDVPNPLPNLPTHGSLACVVDSGVVAGHPLLRGTVIEEEDFGSGEATVVDQNGHGTRVAGLVVYGDIARRMVSGDWFPQVGVCVAKVLRHQDDPFGNTEGWAEFPDEQRAEELLRDSIEYFHRERGVRIFNLSIGHRDRVYNGGRQLPWAELLDELAKRLDLVIVVSAGNVPDPVIPQSFNSQQLQNEAIEHLGSPEHRVIDPATAALCLTVGSITRRADPYDNGYTTRLAITPEGAPSVFTRSGLGVAGAIKPELVHYGGNYAVDSLGDKYIWQKNDPNLGEPSTTHDFATRGLLRASVGTSFAAARVTHIAAQVDAALREQLGSIPSANLIRAVVANSAKVDRHMRNLFNNQQSQLLKIVGYGIPSVEASWSSPSRVTLFSEDVVAHRTFHVYSLNIPSEFLNARGRRSVRVSLAYNPSTRLSRRDYISTAMWLEVYRGLTSEQIIEYRSASGGDGEPPVVPNIHKLDFKPGGQTLKMSTLQTRSWESNQGTKLNYSPVANGEATLHIFVGCQPRFPSPLAEDKQAYALVVTLEHENQNIDLYQQVRNRVRPRIRV